MNKWESMFFNFYDRIYAQSNGQMTRNEINEAAIAQTQDFIARANGKLFAQSAMDGKKINWLSPDARKQHIHDFIKVRNHASLSPK